jgi:hypothetical protein
MFVPIMLIAILGVALSIAFAFGLIELLKRLWTRYNFGHADAKLTRPRPLFLFQSCYNFELEGCKLIPGRQLALYLPV